MELEEFFDADLLEEVEVALAVVELSNDKLSANVHPFPLENEYLVWERWSDMRTELDVASSLTKKTKIEWGFKENSHVIYEILGSKWLHCHHGNK